jgi:hypothetical protein
VVVRQMLTAKPTLVEAQVAFMEVVNQEMVALA